MHVVLVLTGTEVGLQETTVCVAAGFIIVGLKFAVIVPTPFIVALVEAEDGMAKAIADEFPTLQPEKAYPELAVADMEIMEPVA